MRGWLTALVFFIVFFSFSPASVSSQDRFPRPDFEGSYQAPEITTPSDESWQMAYLDVIILIVVLIASIMAIFKFHSRRLILAISMFSLIYFGLIRHGCVCPVGSIQNISGALLQVGVILPFTTILLFFLPVIFTLFRGRIYCGAACPLGAVQDLLSLKRFRLPPWLDAGLKLVPPIFLGLAILYASIGSDYIICRWDPFINIFNISGNKNPFIFTLIFVFLSLVVYRPYCRFLCPYGYILKLTSLFSFKHLSITKKECINCGLCGEACPLGQIHTPEEPVSDFRVNYNKILILVILVPLLGAGGAFIGKASSGFIASLDKRVKLAKLVRSDVPASSSDEITAFFNSGTSKQDLFEIESEILSQFNTGSTILGLFIGILQGVRLLLYTRKYYYTNFEADRSGCINCGRCFEYCPQEITERNRNEA
ncbi:MAG: 4Fe-4S binding protein [bacterium]|nr:4Fe-4S binding protein [bacterium]